MSNLNLKQLEAFVAVVECKSFTMAAKRLYLAQSTVSGHIRTMEEELRVVLFRRETQKSIELTADGKRVYQYARDIVSRFTALEGDLIGSAKQELIIGASTVPMESFLPPCIVDFLQEHSTCCCTIKNGDSEQIHRMLSGGDIQIGFVGTMWDRQAYAYDRITADQLVLITPNTPYFAGLHAEGAKGKDLLCEPLLFREPGSGTQKIIDDYLDKISTGNNNLRIKAYVSDPHALMGMVALGAGVSIVSELFIKEQIASRKLLAFALDDKPVCRDIYMVRRKKGSIGGMAEAFVNFARSRAVQMSKSV